MFDPKNLIIDNPDEGVFRVHRSAMTSLEILQMEQERIFNKCWLYLCHESEVENPGDPVNVPPWIRSAKVFCDGL